MGLGDHIICNGLVRHFKELNEKIYVFSKPHNFKNVAYMYRDDEGIEVLPIGEDHDVENYIKINEIQEDVIKCGFWNPFNLETFDETFYRNISIPFEYRFTKFYFKRDLDLENKAYDYCNPNNEKYIFTHGDIDKNKIRNDLKIIENPTNYGIFDILKLIENAEEVHLMESSIKCLVNSYKFDKPKFFYHSYVRGYSGYHNTKGLNEFKIIF